jgi:alkylation response protein AidB-like acyl-CoA dehydrogenase
VADYFELARHLAPQERQVRSDVGAFVDAKVLPVIARQWEVGAFPAEWARELGALGVLGCSLVGYGCSGWSATAQGVAMQELERGDSGVRTFASVQGSLVMYPIHAFGSEEQRRVYLPKMAAGEIVGCFALTEPEVGSNPAAMQTVAVDDGDAFVLRGAKRWVTNAGIADVALVWARLRQAGDEVRGFLVPTGARGVEVRPIERKVSLRASVTGEIHLDDVRVSKDAVLPGVRGMKGPLTCLTAARLGIAWGAVGAASACFECALDYARSRTQFGGRPLAGHQLVQAKLADMVTQITTMQLVALEATRLKEEGRLRPQQVSLAKRHNARGALDVARTARDILGGNGITLDYPVMRHLCNLETVVTYEGTHDIHALVLGQDLSGFASFE